MANKRNNSGEKKFRSEVRRFVLGNPQELKHNVLPTIKDALKHYLHLQHISTVSKQQPHGLLPKIVEDVFTVWKNASLPTISK